MVNGEHFGPKDLAQQGCLGLKLRRPIEMIGNNLYFSWHSFSVSLLADT